MKSNKKILIIGSEGFTGKHLQAFCQENSIPFECADIVGKNVHYCDLRKPDTIAKTLMDTQPEQIINLAAIIRNNEAKDFFELNTIGVINLLNAINNYDNSVELLLLSTADVYGNCKCPISENSPCTPINIYGISKFAMEKSALVLASQHELKVNIARTFNLYGIAQPETFAIPAFAKRLLSLKRNSNTNILKVGNLSGVRDFIHVQDAIHAYFLILNSSRSGEIYNVGSGTGSTIQAIIEKMCSFLNLNPKIEIIQEFFKENEIQSQFADIQKIKQLGWEPQISIEQGLKQFMEYFEKNYNG